MDRDGNFTLPIHNRWTSTAEYVESLIELVQDSFFRSIIGSVHILDFFIDDPDPYHNLIPEEWQVYFDAINTEEFLELLFGIHTKKSQGKEQQEEELKQHRQVPPQSLTDFLRNVREHLLLRGYERPKLRMDMKGNAESIKAAKNIKTSIIAGMSVKKMHEVEHFSEYLGSLVEQSRLKAAQSTNSKKDEEEEKEELNGEKDEEAKSLLFKEPTHLVDYGAGLSYLSRILACPPYDLDLVAIESDPKRIEAGKTIDRKAGLPWSSEEIESRAQQQHGIIINDNGEAEKGYNKHGSIQYFEKKISDGDIRAIVDGMETKNNNNNNHTVTTIHSNGGDVVQVNGHTEGGDLNGGDDKSKEKSLMIISLHSCGNLIHHALNAFLHTPEVSSVAVVGCCYNLMSEKSPADKVRVRDLRFKQTGDPNGFPLSTRLTDENVTFNMASRMLACQAPQNWTPQSASLFFTRHFYRALLQRLFVDRGIINPNTNDAVIIGSLRKSSYASFHRYVTGAVEKITRDNSPLLVDDVIKKRVVDSQLVNATVEEMEEFERQWVHLKKPVSVMWTLMSFCAGCVESMIVVDRWLYLKENPLVKAARVETVFEYSLSPRNLVIFASKDYDAS